MTINDAPIALGDPLPVTASAHRALERELGALRAEKLHQFPERLRLAREYGDPGDNDEYLAILEEEAVVDARLARLEHVLSRARVIEPARPGTVAIGTSVTVRDAASGARIDYVIGSAHAPAAHGTVSSVSPVGMALLGRSRGDTVTVELPGKGRVLELEILALRHLPPT